MWEMMNGMTDGMRNRFTPRRNQGVGTMTAMVIGASVGIAAWEAWRRAQPMSRMGSSAASRMAEDAIDQLQD